jgi:hypothetical protein
MREEGTERLDSSSVLKCPDNPLDDCRDSIFILRNVSRAKVAQRQVLDSLGSLELRLVVLEMYKNNFSNSNGKHILFQESVASVTQNLIRYWGIPGSSATPLWPDLS